VETANALAGYVRTGRLSVLDATEALASLLRLRLGLISLRALAVPALEYSLRYGISAYDACYLALAEQSGAVLVTADRRLAALATRSELVA
jgi:predicted nucleic acid-binding protein